MSQSESIFQSLNPGIEGHSLPESLDAAIDAAIVDNRVAGAVVLVSRDGESVYARAAGFADRETGKPMEIDSLFRLSSVSKMFVSVAAMVLVRKGKLSLDAPITTWLPDFRPPSPNGEVRPITIRHLLTHTSGLGYGFFEPVDGPYHRAGVSDGMDLSDLTLDENVRRIGSVPLLFAPDTAWHYSLSTDVLGAVIERAADLPLPDAVRVFVTDPLGLTDTGFAVADPARLTVAYTSEPSGVRRMADLEIIPLPFIEGSEGLRMAPARAFDANAFPSGGAGMIGSAGDLLALLEVLRNGGEPLLSDGLVEEIATDHTPGMELGPWPGRGFGLGFTVLRDPAMAGLPETSGTWRLGGAYGHSWFVDRAKGLSAVAFTNAGLEGQSPGGRFPDDITRAIYAGL